MTTAKPPGARLWNMMSRFVEDVISLMRQGGGEAQLDASQLLHGRADAYLDVAHLSKIGNTILGKSIYSAVMKAREGHPLQ